MKRFLAICLSMLCCFTALILPVCAAEPVPQTRLISETRFDLPDGGYIIEELVENSALTRASGTKSGYKTSTRYNSNGHALYAVEVIGSFEYDGSIAKATSASASVYIYDSDVSYVSKSSNYSSNFATATGRVEYLGVREARTATLYCDKNGNLS